MKFKEIITSVEEFRTIMGYPSDMAKQKSIDYLDTISKSFIAQSPFILIASSDLNGNFDISPKGDPAGFVKILDDHTLAIPDRLGNRRGDTFMNVLDNPNVGLIFLIPGVKETLRISGTAQIVRDIEIRSLLAHKSRLPKLVLIVKVKEVLMHCAKCIIRSKLWNNASEVNQTHESMIAKYLATNTQTDKTLQDIDKLLEDDAKNELY